MSEQGGHSGSPEGFSSELQHRENALQRAGEVISDNDRPLLDQIDALLEVVRDAMGTNYAIFTSVDEDTFVFDALDVPADSDLEPGETVPLAELPPCKRVVETGQTLAVWNVEAEVPELADSTGEIACYLGAPIYNGDEVYGTFCSYGLEPRAEAFSDWEVTFLELLSNWISAELEQRKREQSLRDAKLQMEAAVEAGAVGTWEWHIPEDKMIVGPSFARTIDVDPDAAREGVSLDKFITSIHKADRERIEQRVEEAVESCGEYKEEYRVWDEDGDLRWVMAQGHVECDDDGNPETFPGALTDITERKQTEQQLEALNERLRASNDRLEQFAYAASHDLQEPLRMVSSYLQLLEKQYGDTLDDDATEYLEFAVDGADRMRAMIEGLLAYSQVETHGSPFARVDLHDVLGDVRTDLQRQIDESDAEITVEALPSIEGDEDQLRQLFQTLLENALKYSGDESPRVHLSAERDDEEWVIAVRDEGIGIDPADQDRIFEVFHRLHSRQEYDGTGIGLALSQRIVERHNGDLWVEADRGDGSTFYITLPGSGANSL